MMSLMSGFPQNNYHHHPLHLHHHHPHHSGMVFTNAAANNASSTAANYSSYYSSTVNSETGTSPPYYWPQAPLDSPPQSSAVGRSDYGSAYSNVLESNSSLNPAADGDVLRGECVPVRGVKRRNTANRKERRRTLSINTAFSDLRECIPNVPSDTKLSKIKTLRLATSYIAYLMDILAKDDPSSIPEGGFKADVCKKMESRDERKKKEMANLLGPSGVVIGGGGVGGGEQKKAKGRTGWPQHVWALELKQ